MKIEIDDMEVLVQILKSEYKSLSKDLHGEVIPILLSIAHLLSYYLNSRDYEDWTKDVGLFQEGK